jgi:hypothetical protein
MLAGCHHPVDGDPRKSSAPQQIRQFSEILSSRWAVEWQVGRTRAPGGDTYSRSFLTGAICPRSGIISMRHMGGGGHLIPCKPRTPSDRYREREWSASRVFALYICDLWRLIGRRAKETRSCKRQSSCTLASGALASGVVRRRPGALEMHRRRCNFPFAACSAIARFSTCCLRYRLLKYNKNLCRLGDRSPYQVQGLL